MVAGGAIGVQFGAKTGSHLRGEELRALLAILVVGVALRLLIGLVTTPFWGHFSDRVGRRPALMIALTASAIAFIVFAFAQSLELLFLCRIVQGAGGGTVGVIQAYVADATKPEDRSKALGWLSAATNAGVAIGPAIGSWAMKIGTSGRCGWMMMRSGLPRPTVPSPWNRCW